jgi:hypothetical protein
MSKEAHNVIEVVEFCEQHQLDAELVGRWVWVTFSSKPSAAIRQSLKDFGFRWSRRRGKWAHNCGHPSRSSAGNPWIKYGHRRISELDAADLAVA